MSEKDLFAFVLIPFDHSFDDIYKLGIKETAKELSILAERLDEQLFAEGMVERIYRQIEASDLIVADMSGRNPNVFYEVGYAHARDKLCILLTKNPGDIPFDLKHRRHIVYTSISNLKTELKKNLEWAKQEVLNVKKSKIRIDFKMDGMLEKENNIDAAIIWHTFDLFNDSSKVSTAISAIYLYTGHDWHYQIDKNKCPTTDSDIHPYKCRYFVAPPVSRLEPNSWAQFKVSGRRYLASSQRGDKLQESYDLKGSILLRLLTTSGNFDYEFSIDHKIDTLPF